MVPRFRGEGVLWAPFVAAYPLSGEGVMLDPQKVVSFYLWPGKERMRLLATTGVPRSYETAPPLSTTIGPSREEPTVGS